MATTTISFGQVRTTRLNMQGTDSLIVADSGMINVSSNAQSIRFNGTTSGASIENHGQILNQASGGRAIRFETSVGAVLTATIDNDGSIQSDDDAIQIQAGAVTSGKVTLHNTGEIFSTVGQAVDFAGGTGTFIAEIINSGTIDSIKDDAIRIGAVGEITNSGTIMGGSSIDLIAKADGIQFEDDTTGTVNNLAGGLISGDRHGINVGEGSEISVNNALGATIIGHNGSGVGSDGSATVINYGRITGSFTPGVDVNSPAGADTTDGIYDGDGDGVDIDFKATIENYGIIEGTGAGGNGSDGLSNTSEGIAAGGGTITNHTGATIHGAGLGILIDDSSQGNAFYLTTIVNDGTITGDTGVGIRIVSNLNDTIANSGTISGGNGTAILFGSGNNTLALVGNHSQINGISEGGTGTDTLDYSLYTTSAIINLATGSATGTGGVSSFEYVIGSALDDTITGNGGANKLTGLGGDDTIIGGAGYDRIIGGAGADTLTGGTGGDWFVFTNKDSTSSAHDLITDFKLAEGDRLDFTAVDGDTATRGYQRFSFIGEGEFTGHAGELRYAELRPGDTFITADTNGDKVADLVIELLGSQAVTADYFVF